MHSSILYTVITVFSNIPIDEISILTISPSDNVKSGGGTIEVPVSTVVKSGTVLLL